jgi:hypothetical protein
LERIAKVELTELDTYKTKDTAQIESRPAPPEASRQIVRAIGETLELVAESVVLEK